MLLEWKNAKKRMKVHQEKSSKGGKASVASKLKSKHSSSTGQPTVQPKLKQSEATIPSSTPTSVAVSDASDLIDLKERTKEGSSFDHSTLEQDKSTTTPVQVELTPQEPADPPCEQCKHGIRQGSGPCYQHSTPAESNSENIGSPAASPEAIQLCQYAIAELNATGIPTKSPCLDFWLTEADALLTYSGNESLADLKGMFAFARRDKHFMQYTFGVPDLKRHVMSDSDKGLKQRFYNARYASQKRDAKTEANHPPKKSKFEGKEI
jgi:hypothetical protein